MKRITAVLETTELKDIPCQRVYEKDEMECEVIDKVIVDNNTMYLVYTDNDKARKKLQLISPREITDILEK